MRPHDGFGNKHRPTRLGTSGGRLFPSLRFDSDSDGCRHCDLPVQRDGVRSVPPPTPSALLGLSGSGILPDPVTLAARRRAGSLNRYMHRPGTVRYYYSGTPRPPNPRCLPAAGLCGLQVFGGHGRKGQSFTPYITRMFVARVTSRDSKRLRLLSAAVFSCDHGKRRRGRHQQSIYSVRKSVDLHKEPERLGCQARTGDHDHISEPQSGPGQLETPL